MLVMERYDALRFALGLPLATRSLCMPSKDFTKSSVVFLKSADPLVRFLLDVSRPVTTNSAL